MRFLELYMFVGEKTLAERAAAAAMSFPRVFEKGKWRFQFVRIDFTAFIALAELIEIRGGRAENARATCSTFMVHPSHQTLIKFPLQFYGNTVDLGAGAFGTNQICPLLLNIWWNTSILFLLRKVFAVEWESTAGGRMFEHYWPTYVCFGSFSLSLSPSFSGMVKLDFASLYIYINNLWAHSS